MTSDRTSEPNSPAEEDPAAWFTIMAKMDETWSQLVGQQVELEQKNSALEEAHELIASVFDSMSDLLIACDTTLRIVRCNRAAQETLSEGVPLVGQPLAILIAPDSPISIETLSRRLTDRQRLEDQGITLKTPSGAQPFSVNSAILRDSHHRVSGMVLAARPLGELRRAYDELDRAHKSLQQAQTQLIHAEKMASLGRLVAGVAHELNNPISFVYGNALTLRRFTRRIETYLSALHAGQTPEQLAAIRREQNIDAVLDELDGSLAGITEGAERVRDIVADLRRFSSERRAHDAIFDLGQIARKAVNWVLSTCGREIATTLDIAPELKVEGHSGQLQQVIMNLVQNAVDALDTTPDPHLRITAHRQGQQAILEVADNGPGFTEDIAHRIFDPFFTTKPVGKGTGLGLAICYRTVHEHGGTLQAWSRPGQGTCLTVTLPVRARGEDAP
ncbi:sensor histidine kinase [Acetobacter peroxydans]|uniref:histidine kinase n=1 Tax=Acetobacter peroxydans TaxID=104098 RepID=A0A4Y3TVM8_9PROT|nr:ATP-binding protein [Acetobacter peroxydans]NHO16568.1 PAS domain-containing protein [Acetobacter peroxydans]GBR34030.1 signal transduction histidine kinase [Acetobacter peroxydans NBRC 13755]GBR42920.1 signal transduction histidine kinase [Acetobacter peroxydans]GEB85167.1 PAS domain-containing sensor histidine kinase [Acetobacter peroxydans]